MAMWLVVAAAPPEDKVQPGWLGFFVVLGLGIVTFLLWRSMNKQLKRVNFDDSRADDERDEGNLDVSAEETDHDDQVGEKRDKPSD